MYNFAYSSDLFWSVVILCSVWCIVFWLKKKEQYKLATQLNGPYAFPIIGNALMLITPANKITELILDLIARYKSPLRIWFATHLVIHIWDPKQLQVVLNKSLEKPHYLYKVTIPITGQGLLSLPVEKWKPHRRIIAPIFSQNNVKKFFGIIHKHCKNLVEELECKQGRGFFDVKHYLLKNCLDIALDAILRFDSNQSNLNAIQFLKWLESVQVAIVDKMTKKWYLPDFLFNMTPMGKQLKTATSAFTANLDQVIREWKEQISKRGGINSDTMRDSDKPVKFVEYLLSISQDDEKLTEEELQAEVKTTLIGAFETEGLARGHILLVLGMHPDVQENVYQEITQVLNNPDEIQYDDLKKLEYLDRVIKESMRIFPTSPAIARFSTDEFQLEQHTIPAGCTLLLNIFALHRDPNIWPNPTKFDPDRFLPEEVAKRHPYSWLGFSAGPRDCVGYRFAQISLKLAIIEIVKAYRISTIYKDIEDVTLKWQFLFQPTRGYQIKLEPRV